MPEYVLGTDDVERMRLGLQHRLWAWHAHRAWERAGLRPGWRVLDIGCGPGWAAMDMAEIVGPSGTIFGVDESERYVEWFNQYAQGTSTTWASAVQGDVLGLESVAGIHAPFDMAFVRWVLCFVRDPASVVRQAAALLRPGGRLVIQDYFNYESMTLAPRREAFAIGIRAIGTSWRERGGDPDVMGTMPRYLRQAGLKVVQADVIQRVAYPHDQMWTWPTIFWKTFLPRLEATGHLSAEEHRAFIADWDDATSDPDSFIHLPTVYEYIAEKPES